MGASDALHPSLSHRRGLLNERLSRADSSPIVSFGAEHLLMPLALAKSELSKDRRLRRVDAAASVGSSQSGGPVDEVEIVFCGNRQIG